jgi:protein FAM161A
MQARRANEGDPFASPGMLAVERMWNDFSIEDYASHVSYSDEQEKGGKCRDKKEWTPKITVPKPFSMTVRDSQSPKRKSRSMIQAEQERLEREALEEAELRKQFRATPLPASTYLPLYELINAKNEHRREEVKMLSKQILKDSERPFTFTKRDNERRLMRDEEMRRSLELEKNRLKEATFSAKPIPKHLFDPDVAERLKELEDYREIRIRLRAQELLAKSKLPGNMQLKGREYSLGALRKKRLEENQDKAFMTDEHLFHPTVSSSVPDYDRAYLEFQQQLALRKRTKHTTTTEPFYLRTQLIPSRKEQVLQDIQREEELHLRNRWSLTAPSAKVSSRPPKHTRTKSSSGVPYPSQLTKTAKVRFSHTQEKLTHALAKEKALENEERERRERQEALKKTVSQKSLSCDPTVWLEERKQKKYHQFK